MHIQATSLDHPSTSLYALLQIAIQKLIVFLFVLSNNMWYFKVCDLGMSWNVDIHKEQYILDVEVEDELYLIDIDENLPR